MEPRQSPPDADRPLPFLLRVAAQWIALEDLPRDSDGALFFRQRATLTGGLVVTDLGKDVQFSDLETGQ